MHAVLSAFRFLVPRNLNVSKSYFLKTDLPLCLNQAPARRNSLRNSIPQNKS